MPILDDLASALEALTAHNEARVASIAAKSSPTASELALIDDNANYTHLALMRDRLEHEKSPDKAYQALQDAGETLEVDASLQEAAQLKDSESPHLLNAHLHLESQTQTLTIAAPQPRRSRRNSGSPQPLSAAAAASSSPRHPTSPGAPVGSPRNPTGLRGHAGWQYVDAEGNPISPPASVMTAQLSPRYVAAFGLR